MRLKELQERFYDSIVRTQGTVRLSPALAAFVVPGGRLETPKDAMRIYTDGYTARLTESLGELYESVWYVLGDDGFFATCRSFIAQHRSLTYSLSLYGREFPEFLKIHGNKFPFLPDLARFEQAFNAVFHAASDSALPAADVVQLLSNDQRVKLVPSLLLFQSRWGVYTLWRTAKKEGELADDEWQKGERLVLYKAGDKVQVRVLTRTEFDILSALRIGRRLSEIFETPTLKLDPTEVQDMFTWLPTSGLVQT